MAFSAGSRVVSCNYGDLPCKRSFAVRRFRRVLENTAVPETEEPNDQKHNEQ